MGMRATRDESDHPCAIKPLQYRFARCATMRCPALATGATSPPDAGNKPPSMMMLTVVETAAYSVGYGALPWGASHTVTQWKP